VQCGFRGGTAKKKARAVKHSVEVAERRRLEAEAQRKKEEEEAARQKAEFESSVAKQLSSESAALLAKAQAAAELAIEQRYKAQIDELTEQMDSLKAAHKETLSAKDGTIGELKGAHATELSELKDEMDAALEKAAKDALEAAEKAADELESTRKSIISANQERERKLRNMHAEEVALWRALAMQRAAVEQSMMEELAAEIVECVAEWRRIRKNQTLLGKVQGGFAGMGIGEGDKSRSKDGQAELSEVLIKQGKKHADAAKKGSMPTAAPLYHKARFFLRAGATLSKSGAILIESIEMRRAFKSVESYSIAEEECKTLLAEHKKILSGAKGDDGGLISMVSFRPGGKAPAKKGGDDDDDDVAMLDQPLTEGDYGELAKLTKLLALMSKCKEEAVAAREAAANADAVDIE